MLSRLLPRIAVGLLALGLAPVSLHAQGSVSEPYVERCEFRAEREADDFQLDLACSFYAAGHEQLSLRWLGLGAGVLDSDSVQVHLDGDPVAVVLEQQSRMIWVRIPLESASERLEVTVCALLRNAVEAEGDGLWRVTLPLPTPTWPALGRQDAFSATVVLPAPFQVLEAFPNALARHGAGAPLRASLPTVPSALVLRVADEPRILTRARLTDGGLLLLLAAMAALVLRLLSRDQSGAAATAETEP